MNGSRLTHQLPCFSVGVLITTPGLARHSPALPLADILAPAPPCRLAVLLLLINQKDLTVQPVPSALVPSHPVPPFVALNGLEVQQVQFPDKVKGRSNKKKSEKKR